MSKKKRRKRLSDSLAKKGLAAAKKGAAAARDAAVAAGKGAREGIRAAEEVGKEGKSLARRLVEIAIRFPYYLKLYLKLLTDNSVPGKVKAVLATGFLLVILPLLAFLVPGWILTSLFGPLAWIPLVLMVLIVLEFAYEILGYKVPPEWEIEIFGKEGTVERDIRQLPEMLGGWYNTMRKWVARKLDKKMDELVDEGKISEDGETASVALLQEAADKLLDEDTDEAAERVALKGREFLALPEPEQDRKLLGSFRDMQKEMEKDMEEEKEEDVRDRIIEAIKTFVKNNGKNPTRVHLTSEEEWDLPKVRSEDFGMPDSAFSKQGPRKATADNDGKLLGLTVVWDAASFKVE